MEEINPENTEYRAKGLLEIHGVTVERVLNVRLSISDSQVQYSSQFKVALADHNIEMPRIVYQKIAEEIEVSVSGVMLLRE